MSTTSLELHDVQGPSALAGDRRRFFNLTWLLAKKEYKLTYFGSVLGYVWSFMQPLLFFGVLYLVFAVIVQFNKTAVDFPVLLLMNIVLFSFFQAGTAGAIASVVLRENLVRKMHFPRLVIPLATVITAAMQLILNLMVVVLFMVAYGVKPRLTWLLLPLLVVALMILVSGLAMLLSALYVRFRDVAPIWGVLSQTLYFASPVFILIDSVLPHGRIATRCYLFNPVAAILQQARHWMIGGPPNSESFLVALHSGKAGGYSPATLMGGKVWLLVPVLVAVVICTLGFWVFTREAPRIAEEL